MKGCHKNKMASSVVNGAVKREGGERKGLVVKRCVRRREGVREVL